MSLFQERYERQVEERLAGVEKRCCGIDDHVIIGHLSHVSHNSSIGENTVIAPHVCISGSARIGKHVYIAPGVVVSNVKVGDGARLTIGAVVAGNVKAGTTMTGNLAVEHAQYLRQVMSIGRSM